MGMNNSIIVRDVTAADHDAWLPLWQGYQTWRIQK